MGDPLSLAVDLSFLWNPLSLPFMKEAKGTKVEFICEDCRFPLLLTLLKQGRLGTHIWELAPFFHLYVPWTPAANCNEVKFFCLSLNNTSPCPWNIIDPPQFCKEGKKNCQLFVNLPNGKNFLPEPQKRGPARPRAS